MATSGGLARDGWYFIGIGKKKLLRDGVPATAKVVDFTEMDEASNIGNAQHDFTLLITVEGQEPYELQGLFMIPAAPRRGHAGRHGRCRSRCTPTTPRRRRSTGTRGRTRAPAAPGT